jgi:hypothetical protein
MKAQQLCPQTCNQCRSGGGQKRREKPYSVWQNSLDERVDPCQDFYQFTCGTFIKQRKPKTANSVESPLTEIGKEVAKQKLGECTLKKYGSNQTFSADP